VSPDVLGNPRESRVLQGTSGVFCSEAGYFQKERETSGTMALTDTEIRRAKAMEEKVYNISDGGGLYLWISPLPVGSFGAGNIATKAKKS
jgi:hypothetical protein